jgi:hypothetical protein
VVAFTLFPIDDEEKYIKHEERVIGQFYVFSTKVQVTKG